MTEKTLIAVDERTVDFYGDEIKGVSVMDTPSQSRTIYIPIRPLCDFLGVQWSAQRKRLLRDPVLSDELTTIQIQTEGGPQEMSCLPLDMLNGWLFGINASRVKEEIREQVIRYQRECYRVLATAFQAPRQADALTQVEQLGRALITLSREQREFDRRLDATEGHVDHLETRLVTLEHRVAPGNPVTEEQAQQISQAVRAIAYKIGEKTKRNEYGAVYSQLYSSFGITSYKLLPAARYGEAIAFLTDWWKEVTGGEEVPF